MLDLKPLPPRQQRKIRDLLTADTPAATSTAIPANTDTPIRNTPPQPSPTPTPIVVQQVAPPPENAPPGDSGEIPTPLKQIKHFNDKLTDNDQNRILIKKTLTQLRASFNAEGLMARQEVLIHLQNEQQQRILRTNPSFSRTDIQNTLFYSDITAIILDILGWLEVAEYKDENAREKKLIELGRLNGYGPENVYEKGFWENWKKTFDLLLKAVGVMVEDELSKAEADKKDSISEADASTAERQQGAKVTGESFEFWKPRSSGGADKTSEPSAATALDKYPEQMRYQAPWLQNFAVHQIVLQMGLDIKTLDDATLLYLNKQVHAVVLKYLSNPENLAKIYDLGLQNADIARLRAFNDIILDLQNISIKIKVQNKDNPEILEEIDAKVALTKAESVSVKDNLVELLTAAIDDPNKEARVINDPIVINDILHEIDRAIAFKSENSFDAVTLRNIIDIIAAKTGVKLSPEEIEKLKPLLKSFVRLKIGEKIIAAQSDRVTETTLPSAAVPHYDRMVMQFGSKAADAAVTSTKDHLVDSESSDDEKKFLKGSLVSPQMYAQYKSMYAFFFGLKPEEQYALIIANGGKPQKITGTEFYRMPVDINTYDMSPLNSVSSVKRLSKQPKTQEEYEAATVIPFSVKESVSQAEEAKTIYVIEYKQTIEYTESLPTEYVSAVLDQVRAERIAYYNQELEKLQVLGQYMAEADYQQRVQDFQLQIQEAKTAALTSFGFENIVNADRTVYQQYQENPESVLGPSYSPANQSPIQTLRGMLSRGKNGAPNILPPDVRRAQAMAQAAKDLAGIGVALSTGNLAMLLKNKLARDTIKNTLLYGGSIAGGGLAMAYATGTAKQFMTNVGTMVGGPTGGMIGNALGSMMVGENPFSFGSGATAFNGNNLFGNSTASNMSSAVNPQTASPGSVAESLGQQITQGTTPSQAAAGASTTAGATTTGVASTAATAAQAAAIKAASILAVPAILAPTLMIFIVFFVSLYTLWVIQWSFLAPLPIGNPKANSPTFSQYVNVTKTATPADFEDFTTGQTEQVTYTITITPKAQYQIELGEMSDTFSFLGKVDDSENAMVPPKIGPIALFPEDPLEHPISAADFLPEGSETTENITDTVTATYTVTMINGQEGLAKDTLVSNTFKLRFRVFDAQGAFITTATIDAVGSVTIGDPVISGCWPVRGQIKQLPYGTFSHDDPPQDAYDIAGNGGANIYAPFAGQACYKQMPIKVGYGNHVFLTTDTGFTFVFAHMKAFDKDIPACDSAGGGKRVDARYILGTVNSTGNSTGDHLHYELMNNALGKKLPDFIPPEDAALGNGLLEKWVRTCYE